MRSGVSNFRISIPAVPVAASIILQLSFFRARCTNSLANMSSSITRTRYIAFESATIGWDIAVASSLPKPMASLTSDRNSSKIGASSSRLASSLLVAITPEMHSSTLKAEVPKSSKPIVFADPANLWISKFIFSKTVCWSSPSYRWKRNDSKEEISNLSLVLNLETIGKRSSSKLFWSVIF